MGSPKILLVGSKHWFQVQVDSFSQDPAVTGSTTATCTNTPAVPAPSMLRGKTVEDIVNRWSSDLETQARAFSQFATEVAVWDRALIENGNYVCCSWHSIRKANCLLDFGSVRCRDTSRVYPSFP